MSNGIAHGEQLTLFDCPRVRKSEYWQFIKLVAPPGPPPPGQTHWLSQDATDAYCLKCSKMFRFTKGSSNSVRRHMERFHRKELAKYLSQSDISTRKAVNMARKMAQRKGKRGSPGADSEPVLDMAAATITANRPATTAAAATGVVTKPRSLSFGSLEQRNGAELLAKWICLSMRPLSVVDDEGFAEFIEYISSSSSTGRGASFVLPNPDALSHRIDLMVENARFEIRQRVKKDALHATVSIDRWDALSTSLSSSTTSPATFLAVACHYLTEDFLPNRWVLGVVPAGSSDDDIVGNGVLEVLREAGVAKTNVSSVLTDATSLPGAVLSKELECRWLHEVCESMQQLVVQLMGTDVPPVCADIANVISRAMEVVAILRADQSTRDKVLQLAPANTTSTDLHKLMLQPPEELRLPQYVAAAVVVALHPAIVACHEDFKATGGEPVFSHSDLQPLSPQELLLCEATAVLLQPLHEVTEVVVSEKACSLPFIIPCLMMVQQQLQQPELLVDITLRARQVLPESERDAFVHSLESLRNHLLSLFLQRFDDVCRELAWCSLLDPRHGRARHMTDDQREACRATLIDKAVEFCSTQLTAAPTDALPALGAEFDGDIMYGVARAPTTGLMHRLLYDDEEEVPNATDALTRDGDATQTRIFVTNEVAMYVSEHQLRKTRILCPLQWWQANRDRYPFLASLARVWLNVMAASSVVALRHHLPRELLDERKPSVPATTWQRAMADRIFLHTNLRAMTHAPSISL
ncbi:TPA: hypothetical protein N0F65_011555 [Lagenidium giganteum]|uniref:BED-type domain-containing protein n=1 Tax=Lagenidium giganteum TaxID=4803 RepID=A0AAV2YQ20_9STRA|nr:TPA: hypothetical protein N0F65_011555 [Lagenidium giganteum]